MDDLAVLIVNWNVRALLRACLSAVLADMTTNEIPAQVWVVDNASQDGSAEMVKGEFPGVRLIVSSENRGFACGNNLALSAMAQGQPPRYVLLLNPDTEPQPGALAHLRDFMARHPQAGVAGGRLLYGDGSFQHSAFAFPGLWQILLDLYPFPDRLRETRLNGRYPRARYARGRAFPIDHPLGAAMMLRWEAIQPLGFFDSAFHMYCEEIDLCWRVKRQGWEIYCVPQAEIVHHGGQSTSQIRHCSFVNLWRSRHRLYSKHYGPLRAWLAHSLVRLGMRYRIRVTRQARKRGRLGPDEAGDRIRAYTAALAEYQHKN